MGAARTLLFGMVILIVPPIEAYSQVAATPEQKAQLAPTGSLRVGLLLVPQLATKNQQTGKVSGMGDELGRELARALDVPYQPVVFDKPPALVDQLRHGSVDVTFLVPTPERVEALDFGPQFMELETTYLVPDRSSITDAAQIDQPDRKIVIYDRSAEYNVLSKTLKQATLVPVPIGASVQAIELLKSAQADAFSAIHHVLYLIQPSLPGSRIIPGSYMNVPIAIAVAKGYPAAADFARRFIESAKTSGLVRTLIERTDLHGAIVSPIS